MGKPHYLIKEFEFDEEPPSEILKPKGFYEKVPEWKIHEMYGNGPDLSRNGDKDEKEGTNEPYENLKIFLSPIGRKRNKKVKRKPTDREIFMAHFFPNKKKRRKRRK